MSYAIEFPDFVLDVAVPATWQDLSWRNDGCPFFLASPSVGVLVGYSDPAMREDSDAPRFIIVAMEDGMHLVEESTLLTTDDWQAVLAFIDERETLAQRYVDAIGYDPFTDSPMRSHKDVTRTLAEHAQEATHAREWCNAIKG